MGGATAEGNVTPAAEFNVWVDPEAAARVFASGLEVTMIGLDVTHRALMTAEHAERLRAAGRVGTLVAELWAFYHRFHKRDLRPAGHARARRAGRRPRDSRRPCAHRARQRGDRVCVGAVPRAHRRRPLGAHGRAPNAHVGVDVDGEAFLELLVERIGRLG